MKPRCFAWVAIVFALYSSSAARAAPTLDALIDSIRRQEDAFRGIEVESRLQATRQGQFAGDARVRALYDASPYGRARIDFLELKLPWVGGSSPISTNVESYSFDGTAGQSVLYQTGNADAAAIPLEGKVVAEEPKMIGTMGNYASGWAASIYGVASKERRRLSDLLAVVRDAQRDGKAEVLLTGLPDGTSVELQITAKTATKSRTVLQFATDRGFAILLHARYTAGLPVESVRVDELVKDGDRYYPRRFTRDLYDGTGKVVESQSGEVTRVTFADPAGIPPERFKITWPAGGSVTNESTGERIRIGQSPAETRKQVAASGEQFQKLLSGGSDAGTSRPSAVEARAEPSAAPPAASPASADRSLIRTVLVAVLAAAGLCLVAVFLMKSRRKKV